MKEKLILKDRKSAKTVVKNNMKKLKENDIAGDMCLSEKSFMSQNFENYGGPFEKPKKIMMQNNSK